MSDEIDPFYWLEEIERRMARMVMEGQVVEVDHAKQMAKVRFAFGEDNAQTSWIPFNGTAAGEARQHFPLTVGEWVTMAAPGGAIENARIIGRGWTNQNPSPVTDGSQVATTFGSTAVRQHRDKVHVVVGGTTFEVKADGAYVNGKKVLTA